jgi:hypothetical protein
MTLPSGIKTTVTVREVQRAGLPTGMIQSRAPVMGDYFLVAIRSAGKGTTRDLNSYVCRVPGGEVRVLGWIER